MRFLLSVFVSFHNICIRLTILLCVSQLSRLSCSITPTYKDSSVTDELVLITMPGTNAYNKARRVQLTGYGGKQRLQKRGRGSP